MDNLNSLFEKKEFNLIIDLTKDQYDYASLSYRLNSFVSLNRYEDALLLLNDKKCNKVLYSKKPIAIIKVHFKLLKELGKEEEFRIVYNDYINRPYISQEVEEILHDFTMYFAHNPIKVKTIDEYLDNLINSNNEEVLLESILNIKKTNYKEFHRELIDFINRKKVADHLRTFALFMLVDAKINIDINFFKNENNYLVNPSKLVNPFSREDYKIVIDYINNLTKNISISKTAHKVFDNFVIDIYPNYVADEYKDLKLVSAAFLLEAKRRLSDKEDEEEFVTNLGIDYRNCLETIFNIHTYLKI